MVEIHRSQFHPDVFSSKTNFMTVVGFEETQVFTRGLQRLQGQIVMTFYHSHIIAIKLLLMNKMD